MSVEEIVEPFGNLMIYVEYGYSPGGVPSLVESRWVADWFIA